MTTYYAQYLSGERLARCYELATPRMQRYLECEIQSLLQRLQPGERVLELGCGYGRVALRLAQAGAWVTGIDLAEPSLALARQRTAQAGLTERCRWLCMDAQSLDFADERFDVVVCVQNGIAAFGADPLRLAREAWRVLRPAGRLMLSTYVDAIWPERLAWFEAQAAAGLVGPVDRVASRDGTIVCTDGFRSGRATVADFSALALALGVPAAVEEVDASSLWCELRKPRPATDFSSSSTGADSVPTFTRSQ